MDGISRKMLSGSGWFLGSKLFDRSLGFISIVVLARILAPEDFGLIAVATSVVGLLELMKGLNVGAALVQEAKASNEHFNSAWTLEIGLSIAISLVIVGLAKPAAYFYGDPRLFPVLIVLASGALVQGFENIGIVYLQKELNFRKYVVFLAAKRLSGFVVTIAAAIVLENYWALVFGAVVTRAVGVLLSYGIHPFRPKLGWSKVGSLLSFSKWLLINNLLFFGNSRLGDLIIGRVADPKALGLFSLSRQLSEIGTTEIVSAANRAVFPGYSKLLAAGESLRGVHQRLTAVASLIAVPAGFGLSAISPLVVPVVLGPKWQGAVPILEILAIDRALMALVATNGPVFLSLGRPHVLTYLAVARLAVFVPGLIWATAEYGVIGAAWISLIVTVVLSPISAYLVVRATGAEMNELGRAMWRPFLAGSIMYLVLKQTVQEVTIVSTIEGILRLGYMVLLGAAVYSASVLVLWAAAGRPEGGEKFAMDMVQRILGRVGRRRRYRPGSEGP